MTVSPVRAGLFLSLILALVSLPASPRDAVVAAERSAHRSTIGGTFAVGAARPVGPGSSAGVLSSRRAQARLRHQEMLRRKLPGLLGHRPPAIQREALARRKAPASLSVIALGCDFSDSLLWGRDRSEFPDAPPPAREGNYLFDNDSQPLLDQNGDPIYEFAAHDSLFYTIQIQKVADYFETVSRGRFSMTWRAHPDMVNLSEPMGYYGEDLDTSVRLVEMARDVIAGVDADVDFSRFDTVVLIHAGAGQETDILSNSPEQIFSNYLDVRDFQDAVDEGILDEPGIATDDGVLVRHVLILPESETQDPIPELNINGFFGMRGVYCFEFGLRLGMLSLADFDPSGFPDSQGIGNYGLMGYGLFTGLGLVPAEPSAMNRWLMGWADAVEIDADTDPRLGPIGSGDLADTLLIKLPITEREYFLVEYRLQDPDGDTFFSFSDINGNHVPDFWDASSDSVDVEGNPTGAPASSFDPFDGDVWEPTFGGEFDFFMSEFPSDDPNRGRGTGSGLYVWHIDERIIEDALWAGTSTINSDPYRKGVDVEEADGIEDFDKPYASEFLLGWDGDCFRGEGILIGENLFGTAFTPTSVPSSASADGQYTGISISAIDSVNQGAIECDGPFGMCWDYVDHMNFSLRFEAGLPTGVGVKGSARMDDDGPVHDVRVADLDGDGTTPEIVFAGDDGTVWAFRGDLSEVVDGDGDPSTVGVLARAIGPEDAPSWLGPPAVGDVDGDGRPDVVLSDSSGVYAFVGLTGEELDDGDGDGATLGLLRTLVDGRAYPQLVPSRSAGAAAGQVDIAQLDFLFDRTVLHLIRYESGARVEEIVQPDGAYAATVAASPALDASGGGLAVVFGAEDGAFVRFTLEAPTTIAKDQDDPVSIPRSFARIPLSVFSLSADFAATAFVDTLGRAIGSNVFRLSPLPAPILPSSSVACGPVSAGGDVLNVYVAAEGLWLLDREMSPRTGTPYRPLYVGETTGARPAEPIAFDLDGDETVDVLWHDRVGRLHAVGLNSGALEGWPIQGPGEPTGAPAVADVDGDGLLELVTLGGFDALATVDELDRTPITRRTGELRIYDLASPSGAFAPWPQGRQSADNGGWQSGTAGAAGGAASGSYLDAGSLAVYPNPVQADRANARVFLRREGAVQIGVYNLEGQLLAETSVSSQGGVFVDVPLDLGGAVSGLYVCRASAGGEAAMVAFAVVR